MNMQTNKLEILLILVITMVAAILFSKDFIAPMMSSFVRDRAVVEKVATNTTPDGVILENDLCHLQKIANIPLEDGIYVTEFENYYLFVTKSGVQVSMFVK